MTTVALVGPDGSGKTTVAQRLLDELGVPAAYVYMGVNPDASQHQLPTTRLVWALRRRRGVRPDTGPPAAPPSGERSGASRALRRELRDLVRVANLVAEETYRSVIVRREERRGRVVVFDRHYFLDYHAHDIAPRARTFARTLHGRFLAHVLRKPDLVVYLDAPAEVLLARKGEGTLDDLRRRQRDYEAAMVGLRVERVAADQSLDTVVGEVGRLVLEHVRRDATR